MDQKRLLELAGINEGERKTTIHVKDAKGKTYSVYYEQDGKEFLGDSLKGQEVRVVIGKDGGEIAEATIRNGVVVNTDIENQKALIQALIAFAGKQGQ